MRWLAFCFSFTLFEYRREFLWGCGAADEDERGDNEYACGVISIDFVRVIEMLCAFEVEDDFMLPFVAKLEARCPFMTE